jgi:hypothetical protein
MNRVQKIYDALPVSNKPPANLKKRDEHLFGTPGMSYTVPESWLYRIRHAMVSDMGIIIKNWQPLKRFINCYEVDFSNYAFQYTLRTALKSKKINADPSKKYLLIFDNYSGPRGFFHWIADSLTRLVELRESLSDYTVLVPSYFKEEALYQETIALFDIREMEVIPSGCSMRVPELYVPDYIAPSGYFHPANLRKLREHVWQKVQVQEPGPSLQRVYISRKKATRRFVTNEDEVIGMVEKYGFTIVHLEDYSFREQVQLVYQADCLITIHGAALTHIAFMRPGSKVMEFRKEDDAHNNLYFSLASEAGVSYFYQLCPAQQVSTAANNFNLEVDLRVLEENIGQMLSLNQVNNYA